MLSATDSPVIHITVLDIEFGIRKNCHQCPVARGFANALPQVCSEVLHDEVLFRVDDSIAALHLEEFLGITLRESMMNRRRTHIQIPFSDEIRLRIVSFDAGNKILPFSIVFNPEQYRFELKENLDA